MTLLKQQRQTEAPQRETWYGYRQTVSRDTEHVPAGENSSSFA